MAQFTRSNVWFWLMVLIVVFIGTSVGIAAATHDSACGHPDAPKHWVIFPPGWECERHF